MAKPFLISLNPLPATMGVNFQPFLPFCRKRLFTMPIHIRPLSVGPMKSRILWFAVFSLREKVLMMFLIKPLSE